MKKKEFKENEILAVAKFIHGEIVAVRCDLDNVKLINSFNRTMVELKIPVEVWNGFVESCKTTDVFSGPYKNAELKS